MQMPKKKNDNPGFGGQKITDINEIRAMAEARCEEERHTFEPKKKAEDGFTDSEIYRAAMAEQDGDAWLFCQIFRDKLIFDHAMGRWFSYDGYWKECLIEEPIACLDEVIDVYSRQAAKCSWQVAKLAKEGKESEVERLEKKRKLYLKKIMSLQKMSWKKAVLERSSAGKNSLGISGDEWDLDPWWIGCTNGVIELNPFNFRIPKPQDYIKSICPTPFLGINTNAPEWEEFLLNVFGGDTELISFLQRLLGSSLVGETIEQCFPMFWGQGRNGKGTIFEVLRHTLGPLAEPIQAETLMESGRPGSGGGPRSDIVGLKGKRIVWASETNEGQKLNIGKLKWLSGGDSLKARAPFGSREIVFNPTHSLYLITNHRPKADPNDFALWERVFLIPFEFSFIDNPTNGNEKKKDPFLLGKLKKEASGILSWLVRGCLEWQEKQGLHPPDSVKAATLEYRQKEDLIGQFLAERCLVERGAITQAGPLRKAYEAWCEENGYRPVSGNKFSESLLKRFDRSDEGRHRTYIGVRLNVD